jgi:hypothetical protein
MLVCAHSVSVRPLRRQRNGYRCASVAVPPTSKTDTAVRVGRPRGVRFAQVGHECTEQLMVPGATAIDRKRDDAGHEHLIPGPATSCLRGDRAPARVRDRVRAPRTRWDRIGAVANVASGQDAAIVGTMHALEDDELLPTGYRCHGFAIARGVSPEAVIGKAHRSPSRRCSRPGARLAGAGDAARPRIQRGGLLDEIDAKTRLAALVPRIPAPQGVRSRCADQWPRRQPRESPRAPGRRDAERSPR